MKRTLFLGLLAFGAFGQVNNPSITYVSVDPAGACTITSPMQYNYNNGKLWGCIGTWSAIVGGGSTVPGGVNKNVQFNNAGAFGGSNALVWDGTNLGIGTSVPTRLLSLDAGTSPYMSFNNAGVEKWLLGYENDTGRFVFFGGDGVTQGYRMVMMNNGNVGIGSNILDPANGLTTPKVLTGDGTVAGENSLCELVANGTNCASWKSPDLLSANYRLQFPAGSPAAGQALSFAAPDGSSIAAGSWVTPIVTTPVVAFASLPACAAGTEGSMRAISDSTTQVWGATITGGSTNHALAYCDGTNWTVMGK